MKRIIEKLLEYPRTLIVFLSLSVISIVTTINFLNVDTSTDSLINKNLAFKVDQENLKNEFKVLNNNILIKISGEKKRGKKISKLLINDIKNRNELSFYYSPSMDEVFKENFFTFLNENKKKELISKLYENQPFISEINNNPRLLGLNNLLSLMLIKEDLNSEEILSIEKILKNFKNSMLTNEYVDWSDMINPSSNNLFIILGIKKEIIKNAGFKNFYNFLTSLSNKYSTVKVNYTGGLVIDHEEISSVAKGASKAGLLSLFFVTIILWIAFKNFKSIFFLYCLLV